MSRRIRSIKPEILEDEKTAALSDTAFRIFVGLITMTDDVGRFRADARFVEKNVYWLAVPERSVETALGELETSGMVEFYSVRQQRYGRFINWQKHQRVDNVTGKRAALLPGPEEAEEAAATRRESPRLAAGSDRIGSDRKGEDLTRAPEPEPPDPEPEPEQEPEQPRLSERRLKSVPPPPPDPPEAPAPDEPESAYDLARRTFAEAWRAKYREAYVFSPALGPRSEDLCFRDMGHLARELEPTSARAEELLRRWARRYLADSKPVFANERHPARFFTVDLANKYGGLPQKRTVRALDSPPPEPLSPEKMRERAMALVAGMGRGGT